MEFSHTPVLLNESVDGLDIKPSGIYVDGTAGGGGHSAEILKRLSSGKLVSIDQDPDAIDAVKQRFASNENSIIIKGNFSRMKSLLAERGIYQVDGVLLDIGVSSHQLDTAQRGFSFHEDAVLDMRMSQSGPSAKDLVNSLSQKELSRIIFTYGEEKFADSISKGIVKYRQEKPIETTFELAEIIRNSVPERVRRAGHPARKTFQALRIEVNHELDVLKKGMEDAFDLLGPGGRLAVITFHSLEDRIVKKTMADWCQGCTCPPDFPVCVCNKKPRAELVTKKPIVANSQELSENPRSRSAKLRICKKIIENS